MIFNKKYTIILTLYFFQINFLSAAPDTIKIDSSNLDKNIIVLNEELVNRSLILCKDYIIKNQKYIGNFHYQYYLKSGKFSYKDRPVRQAGASWSLSLYFKETGDTLVENSLIKSLDFFISFSKVTHSNARFFSYPGKKTGEVGAVAILSLALIDYLSTPNHLNAEKKYAYIKYLDEFINYLLLTRDSTHLWHTKYNNLNGNSFYDTINFKNKQYDVNSPYYDGECLLALVKAFKYFNHKDLIKSIQQSADACYKRYIKDEIKKDTSQKIIGFYSWGTMSYFELITAGLPNCEKYIKYINLMTDWMVDVHKIVNTNGAALYEGILHAYELAKLKNDSHQLLKLKPIINSGIVKQIKLQVGGPILNDYVKIYNISDNRIIGGILRPGNIPYIRIDNVQHQLCALLYTKRYYFNVK